MIKKLTRLLLSITLVPVLLCAGINTYMILSAKGSVYSASDQLPDAEVALVLGAGVYRGGVFSPILHDRVMTALDLYRSGKIKKLLLSGDHGTRYYDEVNAMKKYLLSQNVPPQDIFLDHAGFETYDSLYRARDIFQVRKMIICTQRFHQYRALFIARNMGIEAYGIAADRRVYKSSLKNNLREIPARIKAWTKILLESRPHHLGNPIPINGDGRQSWDQYP